MGPDLIVSAGNDLVDPLALVTPNHLDQQFLVVGAELAEPTHNVTAVDWTGASFRGEGLGMSSTYDPQLVHRRALRGAPIRAGVAAVLNDLTGIVVWLDARGRPPPSRQDPVRRLCDLRTGLAGYPAAQVGVIPAPVPVPW